MPPRRANKAGMVLALVAVALLTLLAAAALAIDVGRVMVAAGRAQMVADFAALAGANHFPGKTGPAQAAERLIEAYNTGVVGDLSATVAVYGPGEQLPDGRVLGPAAWAIRVTATVGTNLVFARVFGLFYARPTREAMVLYGPVSVASIVPIWIPDADYVHGQPLDFLYSAIDNPDEWVPGNFGWLDPPTNEVSFIELLSGENLTDQQLKAAEVTIGDVLSGFTGVRVGPVRAALQGRIDRASQPPFGGEDFNDFTLDNPRVMIIPLVTYLGGTGTHASFRVERFALTWLESLDFQGSRSVLVVRFVDYVMRAYPDIEAPGAGLWAWTLVK